MKKHLLLLLLCWSTCCFAQQTSIANGVKRYGPLHYRSIMQCIGEKFICLPKPVGLQLYGYSNLRTKKKPLHGVKYSDYVFQLITLNGFEDDYAVFTDARGKKLYSQLFNSLDDLQIESVAPVAEIDSARSLYLGKTLWLKKDFLNVYHPETDKFSRLDVPRLSRVKVVEVLAGFYEFEPVMFTLETDDHRRGYIACTLSGTNVFKSMASHCSFNDCFFESNPR